MADEEVLIVWNSARPRLSRRGSAGGRVIEHGPLRPIAIVGNGEIRDPRDAALERGEALWNVADVEQEIVLTDTYALKFLVGPDDLYCRHSADADLSNVETHSLFANDPEFRLREATVDERTEFDENIYPVTHCANRAGLFLRDVAPEDVPPCDAPKLIGLSDIDGDLQPEFWATDVTKWSTGIAVWERTPKGYERIFSACPGCSD